MKLTKDILDKVVESAGITSNNTKVMFNWSAPSGLTSLEYQQKVNTFQMLFNNYQDGLWDSDLTNGHFFEEDQTKLISDSLTGISIGSTLNALSHPSNNTTGYGTFAGTDLILIPEKICYEDWSVVINFEEADCPSDTSKRRVLLSTIQYCTTSTGTTTTTSAPLSAGFRLGINGAKNLFYEYYGLDGALRGHTILNPLEDRNIIAVAKSQAQQTVDIYIFNPVDLTIKKTSINTEKHRLTEQWYLGGVYPIPISTDMDQMFVGKIYEFLLFSKFLSEDQVVEICGSLLLDSLTNAGYQTVTETYYPSTGITEQQVQIGTEVTGSAIQQFTLQDANSNVITLYDLTPVTSPVYGTETSFTLSTTASTRDIEEYVPSLKVYDYTYIKNYAPLCILLSTTDTSSKNYEIYTSNKHTKYIGKKASFSGAGYFLLEEDYGSTKSVVIYVNGLLQEKDTDYTRDGIIIKKYTGTYTESDVLIYDVIDNGVQDFIDFTGSNVSVVYSGRFGQDVYLDGIKLVYESDYDDGPGGDLTVFAASLAAGRMAFVTRHSDIDELFNGTISLYDCFTHPLISEQLWINGLRQLKGVDYSLKSACDLSNSNSIVPTQTTLIYENYESYFNI